MTTLDCSPTQLETVDQFRYINVNIAKEYMKWISKSVFFSCKVENLEFLLLNPVFKELEMEDALS